MAFSPDGKTLALALNNKTVKLYDSSTNVASRMLTGCERRVMVMAFSPNDNTLTLALDDEQVNRWDINSSTELQVLKGDEKLVNAVAFSSDGKTMASAPLYDNAVKRWDLDSGNPFVAPGITSLPGLPDTSYDRTNHRCFDF